VVTHEQFGRDVAGLVEAIRFARKAGGGGVKAPWVGAAALAALFLVGGVFAYQMAALNRGAEAKRQEDQARAAAEKAKQEERKRAADAAAANKKADEEARAKVAEVERQRLAMLQQEAERKRAEAAEATKPGRTFRDCPECPEMIVVPAGSFTMGSPPGEEGRSPDEGPQHRVTIARPLAVGKFEVTFAEWDACVAAGGCTHRPDDRGWGRGKQPVINVSWNDVTQQYLTWLSGKTGKTYRLLTEAEWEYAARAGTTTRFWWGSSISTSQANYNGNYTFGGSPKKGEDRQKTVPVDSFAASPWGLHNVHGNVWEWVEDCSHDNYQGAPTDGSAWTTSCSESGHRVLRGGSWVAAPWNLRSAFRASYFTHFRYDYLGFRVARMLTP
jgi:formylglycine-generating enzyme required for sulfatase activity